MGLLSAHLALGRALHAASEETLGRALHAASEETLGRAFKARPKVIVLGRAFNRGLM